MAQSPGAAGIYPQNRASSIVRKTTHVGWSLCPYFWAWRHVGKLVHGRGSQFTPTARVSLGFDKMRRTAFKEIIHSCITKKCLCRIPHQISIFGFLGPLQAQVGHY